MLGVLLACSLLFGLQGVEIKKRDVLGANCNLPLHRAWLRCVYVRGGEIHNSVSLRRDVCFRNGNNHNARNGNKKARKRTEVPFSKKILVKESI